LQNRQHPAALFARLLLCLALAALAAPAAARAWTWPVEGPVLRPFDFDDPDPQAPGQHRGIDIGAASGTPVRAPVDATVTFAGTVPYGGKTLSLLTASGLSVTLLHLGSFVVTRGATVVEGDSVGTVGPSGQTEVTVPFVYMGVRRADDPQGYLDPLLFLPQLPTETVPPPPDPEPAPAPAPAPVAEAPLPGTAAPVAVEPPAPAPPSTGTPQPGLRVSLPEPGAGTTPAPSHEWPQVADPTARADHVTSGATSATNAAAGEPLVRTGSELAPQSVTRQSATAIRSHLSPADGGDVLGGHALPGIAEIPAATALRPPDAVGLGRPAEASSGSHRLARPGSLLALVVLLAAALWLGARKSFGSRVRIIDRGALLPDDSDLLRQLEAAHRPRVHDDRRRRTRPAPSAAR